MKLKKFIIENFRSYNEPVSIPISDFQVFVGKNDAGKSTILEALDIFSMKIKDRLNGTKEILTSILDQI